MQNISMTMNILLLLRKYALRRVRDYFKDRKVLTDPQQIEHEYHYGLQSLEMLKRQARAITLHYITL